MVKTFLLRLISLALLAFSIAACSGDNTTAVSYTAYNHTDKSIVSIIVNGEGGILHATKHAGGAEVCCVVIPNEWRPGLTATIKWQNDDIPVFDKHGKRVVKNGVPVSIESPWKERTVAIPKYDDQLGQFHIHFFPHDEVKVVVTNFFPGHPQYPLALPNED